MTELLSLSDFFAEWERHFDQPVHPFAARLLAPVQQVWLKPYDDEDTLWCVSERDLSFIVGFVLTRSDENVRGWSVHLPSNVFARTQMPRTHFWVHQRTLPGSDRTSVYAKYDAAPEPAPFCVLEVTFAPGEFREQVGRVIAAAFFGGKEREE